jgi:hypothetical protein
MFNTQCWDNMGQAYAKQPIESVIIVMPGDAATTAFDFTLHSVRDQ